ncbi:hypothetical protein HaLaN_32310, partial [Haematococcus lacustris]
CTFCIRSRGGRSGLLLHCCGQPFSCAEGGRGEAMNNIVLPTGLQQSLHVEHAL